MIFTTSWDDGYGRDKDLAELLTRYGVTGTFYVCPQQQHDLTMLTEEEVARIGFEHEIGAHTITHPKLTKVDPETAEREIRESKEWVERVTRKPCTMFCYPYGDENEDIRRMVREAGFTGARTTEGLRFERGGDPFGLPTTLHVYPYPWRRRWKRWWHVFDPLGPLRVKRYRLRELGIPLPWSWLSLSKALFTHALKRGKPVFHLWGHSYELDRYNMWSDLEAFLQFVSQHKDVLTYDVNSALIERPSGAARMAKEGTPPPSAAAA